MLEARLIDTPYVKDYDAIKGHTLQHWLDNWDLSNWGMLSALISKLRVGGVVIAFNTDGIDLLEGRKDLAVIWELCVLPKYRNQGIGVLLFQAAEEWAQAKGCNEIKVRNSEYKRCSMPFLRKTRM